VVLAEARELQYEVARGRPPPLPGDLGVPLSPPLPMRPEPPPRLHRYDEGTEEGLQGYVVLELFGGVGTGAMAMIQAGIRICRYIHIDPEDAGFEAALRG